MPPRKGMKGISFFQNKPTPSPPASSQSRPLYSYSNYMLKETVTKAENIINKWNPDTSAFAKVTSLFYESKAEAQQFVKCVMDLQRAMHFLISQDPSSELLIRAHNLMQMAMKRLEKEFYQILSINRDHLDPESISGRSSLTSRSSITSEDSVRSIDEIQIVGNSIVEVEHEAAIAMSDLKSIADCMISCGYGKECVRVYKIIRKSIIDEGLYHLGIEPISSNKIQKMDWEIVEHKIKNWLIAVQLAVKTLFYGERILCDHVFANSNAVRESCFSEISREGASTLFGFPELVIKSKKSSDKIFRVLDMYSAITNLWPEVDTIFSFESTFVIRSQAVSSLAKLGDLVHTMLTEFELSIQKQSKKMSSVHNGGIHPLTQYVMNYVSVLADYSTILPDIITDWRLPTQTPLPEYYFSPSESDSPLSIPFAWLVLVLLSKLDRKAELYKDVTLSYLFLANNLRFIISKVRRSNLQFILGDDWIMKHELKVKQHAANYERVGWHKVLSALPESLIPEISPDEAKSCFKRFNSAFETAYQTQMSWTVPDAELREEIKVSIAKKVGPVYRLFYEKYHRVVLREERVVRFMPDDLENSLSDLFYGGVSVSASSSSMSVSSRYSSSH